MAANLGRKINMHSPICERTNIVVQKLDKPTGTPWLLFVKRHWQTVGLGLMLTVLCALYAYPWLVEDRGISTQPRVLEQPEMHTKPLSAAPANKLLHVNNTEALRQTLLAIRMRNITRGMPSLRQSEKAASDVSALKPKIREPIGTKRQQVEQWERAFRANTKG